MVNYTEKIEKMELPVLPLKTQVAFPSVPINFEIEGGALVKELGKIEKKGAPLLLLTQKEPAEPNPNKMEDFYKVGTVATVREYLKLPENGISLLTENRCRASVLSLKMNGKILTAEVLCKTVSVEGNGGIKGEILRREAMSVFERFRKFIPKLSKEILMAMKMMESPGMLADFIACHMLADVKDKVKILEEFDPLARLELLSVLMEQEIKLLEAESEIHKRVVGAIEAHQREFYLKEQMKVIREELGDPDGDSEIDEYYDKIQAANLPGNVREKLHTELKRLSKMPFASAESGLQRNYIDFCLDYPWMNKTRDRLDVEKAKKILERDHNGLEKVKERIVEYLATKKLNPELKNQILCLVGPPGTGKTSISRSIAEAMNRKMVRVSLGGVRDEADIRGHRKTYVGAMPGRIVAAIAQAKVSNPLILLDEIDKLSRDAHGDPASALLETLDGEQNHAFRDHYMELPVDLTDCVFVTTANSLDTIPRPLIDRMEIIEVKMYNRHEKLAIAKDHLIKKQMKRHGLKGTQLKITDDAVLELIDFYTAEAGVRNLEREIATLCRKTAVKIVSGEAKKCVIDAKDVSAYLGVRKILPELIGDTDEIGVVNGLAYTDFGGDLLKVETAVMPGSGKIELTGSLGDVMKESAAAAVSYIRAHADEYGVEENFYKTKDIHIHFPEGATPKDGPSAGVAIATSLLSELTGRAVRREVAMTGEITLRGRVLAIGGLREKTMAAYKAGVKKVLIPKENERDLEQIDALVKENVEIVLCSTLDEALVHSLTEKEEGLDSVLQKLPVYEKATGFEHGKTI